jgi:hypothetical protein
MTNHVHLLATLATAEIEEAARRRAAPFPPGPMPAAARDTRQIQLLRQIPL